MTYVPSYSNQAFLKLVKDGKLKPPEIPANLHMHWVLVRGYPKWVVVRGPSEACGTVRCGKATIKGIDGVLDTPRKGNANDSGSN